MSLVLCYASSDLRCYDVFSFCFVCVASYFVCSVVCIVSLYVYYCSLFSEYTCKDHCHRVETQVQ